VKHRLRRSKRDRPSVMAIIDRVLCEAHQPHRMHLTADGKCYCLGKMKLWSPPAYESTLVATIPISGTSFPSLLDGPWPWIEHS